MLLDNGITFAEKHRPFTNTLTFIINLKGGRLAETSETAGIGDLFADVLLRSSPLFEKSEANGFNIFAHSYLHSFSLGFSTPTYMAKDVLKDFEEFILSCKLLQDKFLLEQQLCLSNIEAAKDNPEYQAQLRYFRIKYGDNPFGWSPLGTTESVKNLTLQHLEDYCALNFKAGNASAVIVGNYDHDFKDAVLTMLSKLPKGTPTIHDYTIEHHTENIQIEESYKRIVQSHLVIGYDAPDIFSKEYLSSKILSSLLGNGMSSRYFERIRKELGYAYYIASTYSSIKDNGYFMIMAGIDYKNLSHTIEEINSINANLKTTLTQEELEKAKNSVLGHALMGKQTNFAIAKEMVTCMHRGFEPDFNKKALEKTEFITKQNIIDTAEAIFTTPCVTYILKPENQ